MITRVSSHQPSFFPWAGYWNKFAQSDVHVMSCGVQFDAHGWQNRVKVTDFMAVLPVEGGSTHKLLKHVCYKAEALPKVLASIRQALTGKKWPGRWAVEQALYETEHETAKNRNHCLMDLNIDSMLATAGALKLLGKTQYVIDTEESLPELSKTQRLVARVRRHVPEGRIHYLAGSGALGYIDSSQVPADFELYVQKPKDGAPPHSILQSIAQGDVAEAMSERWFEWTKISPRRGASES